MSLPTPPATLHPAVARSLAAWHDMAARRDMSQLPTILHPQAVFRSPMAYHRQLASDDGLNVVLEFSARVGERELKGIDLVRFDENGLIVDFEVMVRPMSGLQALGDQMARRLAAADKR
jgi:hypothetical protein